MFCFYMDMYMSYVIKMYECVLTCSFELYFYVCIFFFFKQKTAYEMLISDWSSDVCSSGLAVPPVAARRRRQPIVRASKSRTSAPASSTITPASRASSIEIGRASCRERVCQYV